MDFFNDAPPPAAADPTPALEPEPTAGEKRPREDGEGMPGEGMSFADMEQQRRDQAAAEAAQAAAAAAQAAAGAAAPRAPPPSPPARPPRLALAELSAPRALALRCVRPPAPALRENEACRREPPPAASPNR